MCCNTKDKHGSVETQRLAAGMYLKTAEIRSPFLFIELWDTSLSVDVLTVHFNNSSHFAKKRQKLKPLFQVKYDSQLEPNLEK